MTRFASFGSCQAADSVVTRRTALNMSMTFLTIGVMRERMVPASASVFAGAQRRAAFFPLGDGILNRSDAVAARASETSIAFEGW